MKGELLSNASWTTDSRLQSTPSTLFYFWDWPTWHTIEKAISIHLRAATNGFGWSRYGPAGDHFLRGKNIIIMRLMRVSPHSALSSARIGYPIGCGSRHRRLRPNASPIPLSPRKLGEGMMKARLQRLKCGRSCPTTTMAYWRSYLLMTFVRPPREFLWCSNQVPLVFSFRSFHTSLEDRIPSPFVFLLSYFSG
jgi:hypothetical protein